METGGAAPLRPLVTRGRVTVTDPGTGASMMVTPAVGGTWCVAQITARSSDIIIMRRTTAARDEESFLESDLSFKL